MKGNRIMVNNYDIEYPDPSIKDVLSNLSVKTAGNNSYSLFYYGMKVGMLVKFPSSNQLLLHCTTSLFPNAAFFTYDIFFQAVILKAYSFCKEIGASALLLNNSTGYIGALRSQKEWESYNYDITFYDSIITINIG